MGEWQESSNRRRNARQTVLPVIRPPAASGKNTKKWCRGKVGREHKPQCINHNSIKGWKILACTECGKHLDFWWPMIWRPKDEQAKPPAWVVFDDA
jgi:hypothetical protein